jgi:hypothetical protein
MNWETCNPSNGLCDGNVCTVSSDCADSALCVSGVCTTCTTESKQTNSCPSDSFCSTGETSQAAYPTGTCYATECVNSDCTSLTEYCSDVGICETPSCTNNNAHNNCSKTNACVNGECATCALDDETDPLTSNCPSNYYCNVLTTACYKEKSCTAENVDSKCEISQFCNTDEFC